ncbi:pentapeptide repeat-containing protein [Microbacterium sp. YY-03]|uniref:pentapeptide repeat-containing protein n=1 Tax=Microbacterium sp. YY-03 TaxID=3421636 RepID=UPI003D1769B9
MAIRSSLTPPRADSPDLPNRFDEATALRPHGLFEGVEFATLEDADGTSSTVRESVLRGVSCDTLVLKFADISDVEFRDLRVASLQLRGAHLGRVRFVGGRIGTLDLTEAGLDAVVFDGVRIDYLTLGRASVRDVDVRHCLIDTLDMPVAKLNRVRFVESTAGELDPRESTAQHVDLRGLDFARVTDMAALRGMTISVEQAQNAAVALATAAGIRVAE